MLNITLKKQEIKIKMNNNKIEILPKVLTIEKSIISAFLRADEAKRILEMGVTPQMFTDLRYIEIFKAGQELLHAGLNPDMVAIAQQLELKGKLSYIGSEVFLAKLYEEIATTVNIKEWIIQLRDNYGRRELINLLNYHKTDFLNAEKGAFATFNVLKKSMTDLEEFITRNSSLPTVEQADKYLETLSIIQKPNKNENGVIVPWGIDGLNNLCPLQKGQIFILSAGVNVGKTRFILSDLAGNLQNGNSAASVIFSKENANRVIWDGLVSIISNITGRNLNRENGLNEEETQKVNEVISFLKSKEHCFRLYGKGEYDPTPKGIAQKVRHVYDYTKGRLSKVYIDYIQNHKPNNSSKYSSSADKVENFIQELSNELAPYPVAIVLLSQVNRNKDRGNSRLNVHDLKGSSAIEQEADYIAFLQKDPKKNYGVYPVDFYSVKTRGGTRAWNERLSFNQETGEFSRVIGEHEEL